MDSGTMIQCLSCNGLYEPIQNDMLYFHVCPPYIVTPKGELIPTPSPRNENYIFQKDATGNVIEGSAAIKSEGLGAIDVDSNLPYDITKAINISKS